MMSDKLPLNPSALYLKSVFQYEFQLSALFINPRDLREITKYKSDFLKCQIFEIFKSPVMMGELRLVLVKR